MNKASISKPLAKPAGGQAATSNTASADQETPTKITLADGSSSPQPQLRDSAADESSGTAGQADDGSIGAPLLRAKQSQQARNYYTEGAAGIDGGAEPLDISFISVDTIKALFDFMHVEAGDEGERNIDQVLAAQSSLEGRGRPSNPAARRGISKEPTPTTPTPASIQQNDDLQ